MAAGATTTTTTIRLAASVPTYLPTYRPSALLLLLLLPSSRALRRRSWPARPAASPATTPPPPTTDNTRSARQPHHRHRALARYALPTVVMDPISRALDPISTTSTGSLSPLAFSCIIDAHSRQQHTHEHQVPPVVASQSVSQPGERCLSAWRSVGPPSLPTYLGVLDVGVLPGLGQQAVVPEDRAVVEPEQQHQHHPSTHVSPSLPVRRGAGPGCPPT